MWLLQLKNLNNPITFRSKTGHCNNYFRQIYCPEIKYNINNKTELVLNKRDTITLMNPLWNISDTLIAILSDLRHSELKKKLSGNTQSSNFQYFQIKGNFLKIIYLGIIYLIIQRNHSIKQCHMQKNKTVIPYLCKQQVNLWKQWYHKCHQSNLS